jgi:hypothetical protein
MTDNISSSSGCELATWAILVPVAAAFLLAAFVAWKAARALVDEAARLSKRANELSKGLSAYRTGIDARGDKAVMAAAGSGTEEDTVATVVDVVRQELSAERFVNRFLSAEIEHLRRHVRALEGQADRLVHQITELELELAAYQPGTSARVSQTPHAVDVEQLEGVDLWLALEVAVSKTDS